jgi:aldose 1-epimerase
MVVVMALPAFGQYSAQREGDVVRLADSQRRMTLGVLPSRGNMAFELTVKGKNVLYFPFASVEAFKAGRGGLMGIPFLAPWANRLDEPAFYANGKKYVLNPGLGNIRAGDNHPMHGFLGSAQWEVVEAKADGKSAWVTSKLDFYKQPTWMAQFPFAHTIEMTYRLRDGTLQVTTTLTNLSAEPMPVSVGFHPYYKLDDSPRDEWTFGIGAKTEWVLDPTNVPTGVTRPIEQFLPQPQGGTLKGLALDHVFGDLIRDSSGKAMMWVKGKSERIDIAFGPKFKAVVVYSPGGQGRDFICFEPMAGITNAMNMAQKGTYKELQSIPPGEKWQESFWVTPSGW